MKPRKVFFVIAAVFAVWLVVTAYFHYQHLITIKSCNVYEKLEFGDQTLYITEIRWDSYMRDVSNYPEGEGPWYWNWYVDSKLSPNLSLAIYRLCDFYSRPYIKTQDTGMLTVKGIRIGDISQAADVNEFNRYLIFIHDCNKTVYKGEVKGALGEIGQSNVLHFYRQVYDVPKDSGVVGLTIYDTGNKITRTIGIYPKWNTHRYSFFEKKPYYHMFEPETTLNKFAEQIKKKDRTAAQQYILEDRRDTFPWARVEHTLWKTAPPHIYACYEGSYGNYENVYSCQVEYTAGKGEESEIVARQALYLVLRDAVWQIIDAGELTK
jgi:hypothetical protein